LGKVLSECDYRVDDAGNLLIVHADGLNQTVDGRLIRFL
jgi:hypothetical protein